MEKGKKTHVAIFKSDQKYFKKDDSKTKKGTTQ